MRDVAGGEITNVDGSVVTQDAIRSHSSDLRLLQSFSARIGRDPLLVQASSGNTSVKRNGTLWIKASGQWLAHADGRDIFVPVSLPECLERFREGCPLPPGERDSGVERLLPSVETFMHAVLPHRVVIHVHSIDTLAWAVRLDATARLAERLTGLRWDWIPYVPSGLPLAQEIQRVSATHPDTDVFVLGNHGLVVCGPTCEAAEAVLAEVQRRVATEARESTGPYLTSLLGVRGLSGWRLPEFGAVHTLGTDANSTRIAQGGVLYPCQAMFLGSRVPVLAVGDTVTDPPTASPFLIVEGGGVVISETITAAAWAVLRGFAEVLRRIDPAAPLRYLTDDEVETILSVDGHRYRMSAESGGPSGCT